MTYEVIWFINFWCNCPLLLILANTNLETRLLYTWIGSRLQVVVRTPLSEGDGILSWVSMPKWSKDEWPLIFYSRKQDWEFYAWAYASSVFVKYVQLECHTQDDFVLKHLSF